MAYQNWALLCVLEAHLRIVYVTVFFCISALEHLIRYLPVKNHLAGHGTSTFVSDSSNSSWIIINYFFIKSWNRISFIPNFVSTNWALFNIFGAFWVDKQVFLFPQITGNRFYNRSKLRIKHLLFLLRNIENSSQTAFFLSHRSNWSHHTDRIWAVIHNRKTITRSLNQILRRFIPPGSCWSPDSIWHQERPELRCQSYL